MKKGFTLTEVLITLGILGIVSILTVPNFTRGMYKKNMIATLKSTYSQLQTAVTTKMADDGVYIWEDVLPDSDDELPDFAQSFLTDYLDVAKICQTYEECFSESYGSIQGVYSYDFYKNDFQVGNSVVLTNKSTVMFYKNSSSLYRVYIDVNGKSSPNKSGIDFFAVDLDDKGNLVAPYRINDSDDYDWALARCEEGDPGICFGVLLYNDWEPVKF